ncbi:unnamed protein product [Plutella xylostella]|uniref:(diamondback moth) hypothetical protein n=1 Tax=Plutella xylostella TaxID=51655 RepID=A0A8S4EK66_PLUXY|nr:unnamed protein product [Plutella xylostella]
MLAECESEKSKWVVALGELHRILRRNQPPDRQCLKETCLNKNPNQLLKKTSECDVRRRAFTETAH